MCSFVCLAVCFVFVCLSAVVLLIVGCLLFVDMFVVRSLLFVASCWLRVAG